MAWLDSMIDIWAAYYDTAAWLVVCYLAFRLRSTVALIVLADFTVTYSGQNWLKSLELWGSFGLDYHYILGIKDGLVALALLRARANTYLIIAYILASLFCWSLWFAYLISEETFRVEIPYFDVILVEKIIITRDQFIYAYRSWSTFYAISMILQVLAMSGGDKDAGKRSRRRHVFSDWNRVFQHVDSIAHSRNAIANFKIKRARR